MTSERVMEYKHGLKMGHTMESSGMTSAMETVSTLGVTALIMMDNGRMANAMERAKCSTKVKGYLASRGG